MSLADRAAYGMRRWCEAVPLVLCLALEIACGAQEGMTVPSTPGNPYTLHVYANRVQVATLVMDSLDSPEAGLVKEKFKIQLDAGPVFHPLLARVEGDDPLTLGVLIDATAVTPGMQAAIAEAFASMGEDLLSERDHVSIYAVGCALVRAAQVDVPATKEGLRAAVASALGNPRLHREFKLGMGCDATRRLFDSVAAVGRQIGSLPGRRVMIVVSDGYDSQSVNSWNVVREYLDSFSIALFGLRTYPEVAPTVPGGSRAMQKREDPFSLLCAGTGGTVLKVDQADVGAQLNRAVQLIRSRYILEFQRPQNSREGIHLIEVSVPDRKAIVRPGGVGVKLEDPALAKDPSTVPSDQSHAPLLGNRRTLSVAR